MRNPSSGWERSTNAGRSSLGAHPLALRFATAAIVFVLLIARRPQGLFSARLWAEDGTVFYVHALTDGAARSILEPYAGYLQFIPRLATVAVAHVPAIAVPTVYAMIAYMVAAWACSLFIDRKFSRILGSTMLRFLVCCAFAVLPRSNELLGCITNVHWYLSLGALLLLIGDSPHGPTRWLQTAASAVIVLAASLSGAEAIMLIPIAVWRLIRGGDVCMRLVPAALLLGSLVQCVVVRSDPSATLGAHHGTIDAALAATFNGYIQRVVIASTSGQDASEYLVHHSLYGTVLIILLGFTILCTVVTQRLPTRHVQFHIVGMIALALVFIASAMYVRDLAPFYPGFNIISYGAERYFFLPVELFIVSVALVIDRVWPKREPVKAAIFAGIFCIGFVSNFREADLPYVGWAAYAPQIDRWITEQRSGQSAELLSVPTNPPGWSFALPALSRSSK